MQNSRKITSRMSSTSTRPSNRPKRISRRAQDLRPQAPRPASATSRLRCSESTVCSSNLRCRSRLISPLSLGSKIILRKADQGRDQLGNAVAAAGRNPKCRDTRALLVLGARPAPVPCSRSILLRTSQTGALTVDEELRARSIVGQPQHQIGFRRARAGAPHAFLLDGIVGLANAGGVDHRHRIAVEIELHLDDVARRAGMRRHDRDLAPRQLIHQRRFADIRRTCDRDHQAVAQAFTSALCRKHFLEFRRAAF